jgi:hypothetical protein
MYNSFVFSRYSFQIKIEISVHDYTELLFKLQGTVSMTAGLFKSRVAACQGQALSLLYTVSAACASIGVTGLAPGMPTA